MLEDEEFVGPPAIVKQCRVQMTVDESGHWELTLASNSECIDTVVKLAKNMGPSSRKYLAKHLRPVDEVAAELVKFLKKGPSKDPQ